MDAKLQECPVTITPITDVETFRRYSESSRAAYGQQLVPLFDYAAELSPLLLHNGWSLMAVYLDYLHMLYPSMQKLDASDTNVRRLFVAAYDRIRKPTVRNRYYAGRE